MAVFIDDKGSLEGYDLQNGNFAQENSKASGQQILMPLFLALLNVIADTQPFANMTLT
ncbi:hypothetical protein ACHOLT_17330 [Desulfitobacterium sp. Sab5]|uniref:hypothetical protein n=1 Tax=Desulfitobacterium nosdiversum TaxID=3375356 RepID=UPI003CEEF219